MNAEQKLGYSLTIFVAGEKFSGLRIVDKTNWNGRGLISSRASFPNLKKREEPKKAGVYVLLGPSDTGDLPKVYIGEGDPVLPRLEDHHSKREFWTSVVMFVSKDQTLNKAKIQHLEARLIELAKAAKRSVLENINTPDKPSLSESEEAEAEGFLEEMLLCFPAIGVPIFDKPSEQTKKAVNLLMEAKGAKAKGYETDDGFVVTTGSSAALKEAASIQDKPKTLRAALVQQGTLVKKDKYFEFVNDYVFNSPSLAAAVVAGNNCSGREVWKNDKGKTLRELQEKEAGKR